MNRFMIEKQDTRNIPIVKNVIIKRKLKKWNTNININKNSWIVPVVGWVSREHNLVRMVRDAH